MAVYQTQSQGRLLDSGTRAMLEKRGKELLGVALLAFGTACAMILGSYSPDDPSWLSVTDEPAQNLLGRFGAAVASPLIVIIGWAAWGIAAVPLVWGARFVFHAGSERALERIVFAPIAIALAAVHASTLSPPDDWTFSFSLGGLFGDTVIGGILGIEWVKTNMGAESVALTAALCAAVMALFVLGFTIREILRIARFIGICLLFAFKRLIWRTGSGRGSAGGDSELPQAEENAWQESGHSAPLQADQPELPEEAGKFGLRLRMPAFARRRQPVEAPAELPLAAYDSGEASGDPRIEEQTARGNGQHAPGLYLHRSEPPVLGQAREGDSGEAGQPGALLATPNFEIDPPRSPSGAAREPRVVVRHARNKAAPPSSRAKAEAEPQLQFEERRPEFAPPPLSLLGSPANVQRHQLSDEALEQNARMLEAVLDDYGVKGEIVTVRPGPVVAMYELEPAPGLKASRVIGLADDIARSMSALSARVSTVPGRSVIGIELPNATREKVVLREILSARAFGDSNMCLPLALGKDIGGSPVVANLARMPHLLIAGTTGSGKSVAVNTMILSLLYKLSPEECRLIMIDPKMLELSVYDGIPHLLSPVVTDPKKAVVALKWVVGEMEERYRKMSKMGVRNIEGYNGRVDEALSRDEMFSRTVQTGFDDETGEPVFETEEFQPERLPYIVVIVDEMADLMMVAGKEIEACIQRLAQMARASGIHLIMATQRPSVDVITGTIKANFPTRVSFQVTSKIDSRTILGEQGAEQLLGMGDMLYMAGGGKITRVHGPFVSDEEVEEIVTYLKTFGPPEYVAGVVDGPDEEKESDIDLILGLGGSTDGEDALYDQAAAIVIKDRKCSTSYIQRKLAIGYNKAARLVEQMEDEGLVSPANHVGKREILAPEH